VWRIARIVGAEPGDGDAALAYRCMALRHPDQTVSSIVPKTSLVEDTALLALAKDAFGHKPVRMPEEKLARAGSGTDRTAIVTTMKNEGPFILEWIAYHRAIGVQDFLIYTNDCTDGTDTMLKLLQEKGFVQHRENPFRQMDLRPQHAALQVAEDETLVQNADWVICMDVDEYINIHAGEGRLADLYRAVDGANMIAITWRLFGNSDIHQFEDRPVIDQFTRCAPEFARKPHQAWGFKTLFRQLGIYKKLGVHRPKGLKPQLWDRIEWVNGSGRPLPREMFRNAWRSTTETYGYDLVTLNHYAVRSAESFLVKRDRGRVNHVDRDQGLAYWFRMNNNAEEDHSIRRMLPALRAELDRLMADPEIAAAHVHSVGAHRAKIAELRASDTYARFYADLTGPRLERLSRLHAHFGANVFLSGPDVIPDEVAAGDVPEDFFFSVPKGRTSH
ncbi:MAG: glycosyltransferase family 2 protein, partial [Paracoccaceae bacterium]